MTSSAHTGSGGQAVALHAYGPGGPYQPMKACGDRFAEVTGAGVVTTKGVPASWIGQAREDGDLIYGGADYMLVDYDRECPGLLDMNAVVNLYPRRVGLIVRKGNPRGLETVDDMGRGGLRVLDVQLEKMEAFQSAARSAGTIACSVVTGEEGRAAWLSDRGLDAWVTYRSWHATMADETDFLPILGPAAVLRSTPVALTRLTAQRELTRAYVEFLRSGEAHAIFRSFGWE